jgi:hypothetical protein
MAREGRHAHPNYFSGEDYIIESRGFRYGFNCIDFRQRAERAAVELDLVEAGILDEEECSDLVQLVAAGMVDFPLSGLAEWLEEQGDAVLSHNGECLIFWLRTLIFRGAWLDQRVLNDEIDLIFDEDRGDFLYYPKGRKGRELGPPPHPSWHDAAYGK